MRCVFSVSDGVVYLDTSDLGISHAYEGHVSCPASKWTFKKGVIQDVDVPCAAATEFLEYVDESLGRYPTWLCPVYQRGQSPRSPYGPLEEKHNPSIPNMLLIIKVWYPAAS